MFARKRKDSNNKQFTITNKHWADKQINNNNNN